MKNKIAIASAFFAASSFSFAEIALTESLSVEGFIDTSYNDSSAGDASLNLNEVEVSFLFDMGGVSARIDIDSNANNGTNGDDVFDDTDEGGNPEVEIEQAFISYGALGGTITVGGIDSQLGFEAFEAPGLYTNSRAYGADNGESTSQLPGTDIAINYTRQLDEVSSLGVSLVDDGSFIGDEGVRDIANESGGDTVIEVAYGRDLGNGLGAFAGYRSDVDGNDLLNAYVTYETGAFTFAAEIVDGENDSDLQFLANYAYAANASVTVRYTTEENAGNPGNGLAPDADLDILTISHQLALTDNLCITTEIRDNGQDDDEHEFSVGALFTF
jgi:hypothetical protein